MLGIASVNQRFPSGPAVISPVWELDADSWNSVIMPLRTTVMVGVGWWGGGVAVGVDEPGVVDAPHPPKRPTRVRSSTSMRREKGGKPRLRVREYIDMAETPFHV